MSVSSSIPFLESDNSIAGSGGKASNFHYRLKVCSFLHLKIQIIYIKPVGFKNEKIVRKQTKGSLKEYDNFAQKLVLSF